MDSTKGIERPHTSTPSVSKGKNYILAIGIDEYTHCPKLHNAVKDAQDFVEILIKRYDFDNSYISTLFNSDATRRKIVAKLSELAQKIDTSDSLIIYFSGHGEFDKVGKQG